MNLLARYDQTMSSREIASATGKRHGNVLRDIRVMLSELGIRDSDLSHEFVAADGQTYTEYHLNRDLTLTLVSGYSAKLRYAVVMRMRRLEAELLEERMTEHGRVVGERMLIENSARWFDKEREYQAEIAELKRLLSESTAA